MQMQNEAHKTKGQQMYDGYIPPAPWACDPIKHNFTILPAASKALCTPEQLTVAAKNAIRNTHAPHTYYTDGSVDRAIPAAAAAVISTSGYKKNWRLFNHASTLQTELVAIAKALEHSGNQQDGNTTIHTDSRGAILALSNKEPKENVYLINAILFLALLHKRNNRQVTLNWIPSHTGISGNDEADHLAKSALMCQITSITLQQ
ncbi:ribonuclease H1-like [Palaemon carinicauda]|uniref:ribonuclease H1-like n=1 Tax=Palaemon carinicauda TaxID=392227 RepID=UPI0035B58CF9